MKNQDLLDGLLKIEGIQGAFLLNDDGVKIVESFREQRDYSQIHQITQNGILINQQFSSNFNRGAFIQGHLEFEDDFLTIEPTSTKKILVVVAKSGSNVGRIRLEMKRVRKQLEEGSA